MHQLFITAAILTVVITGIYAFLLVTLVPKDLRKWLLLLALIELPLQPLAFVYVRRPLDAIVVGAMGQSALYHFITIWYAPVTEELAKLLPVLIFFLFKKIEKSQLRLWMLPV